MAVIGLYVYSLAADLPERLPLLTCLVRVRVGHRRLLHRVATCTPQRQAIVYVLGGVLLVLFLPFITVHTLCGMVGMQAHPLAAVPSICAVLLAVSRPYWVGGNVAVRPVCARPAHRAPTIRPLGTHVGIAHASWQ